MRERINGLLINLNTATEEEFGTMRAHRVDALEGARTDVFILDDYYLRRFGGEVIGAALPEQCDREYDLDLEVGS